MEGSASFSRASWGMLMGQPIVLGCSCQVAGQVLANFVGVREVHVLSVGATRRSPTLLGRWPFAQHVKKIPELAESFAVSSHFFMIGSATPITVA